jgi:hypothetical protein
MTRYSSIMFVALTSLTSLTSLTACLRGDGDLDLVETSVDSSTMSQGEASLLASVIDGAGGQAARPATPQDVATYIAAHAPQRYSPGGCVTVTQATSSVTLAFAGCTGPRGLRQLDGTLVVNVTSAAAGAIQLTGAAKDFRLGGSTLDIDAAATYTTTGSSASLAVKTHTSGVGSLGRSIDHDGEYTVSWTATCVAVRGAWSTEIGEAGRSTTADVARCLDQCPTGSITRDTFRNRTVTLSFDGSSTATWETSAGRSGTVQLACGL